jgi:hypothetical protein
MELKKRYSHHANCILPTHDEPLQQDMRNLVWKLDCKENIQIFYEKLPFIHKNFQTW